MNLDWEPEAYLKVAQSEEDLWQVDPQPQLVRRVRRGLYSCCCGGVHEPEKAVACLSKARVGSP
jgi:hypothetical protein